MGIIMDVGHRPEPVWAPHAAERWARAPLAALRLVSLPDVEPAPAVVPSRPRGAPSRMVAIAGVLRSWRAAERDLTSLEAADPGRDRAEAMVETWRAAYHRLFAEHQARRLIG